jgi:hypothetical protein
LRRKVDVIRARFSVVGVMGEYQVRIFPGLAVNTFLSVQRVRKKTFIPMMAGTTRLHNNFVNTLGVQSFMLTSCREIASAYFREQPSRWRGSWTRQQHSHHENLLSSYTRPRPVPQPIAEATTPHVSVTSMAHIRQDAAE